MTSVTTLVDPSYGPQCKILFLGINMQILRKVIKYEFLDDKKVIKGMTKQEFNAMWLPQNRPPHRELGAKYFIFMD